MKKGISIITLIIALVVLLIITTITIMQLSKSNSIDSARISILATNWENLENDIGLYYENAKVNLVKNYFNKTENILLGIDGNKDYRIVEINVEENNFTKIEEIKSADIKIDDQILTVYKLDQQKCIENKIYYPETPSEDSSWYITPEGNVYLVFETGTTIPNWIGETKILSEDDDDYDEGTQGCTYTISNDILSKFISFKGEYNTEQITLAELVEPADPNLFTYSSPNGNGEVTITGFNFSYTGHVPERIKFPLVSSSPGQHKVIGINASAFSCKTSTSTIAQWMSNVKAVVIPEGYTTVGNCAFEYSNVEEIYIPTTLTTQYSGWNYSLFAYCTKIKKITIPNRYVYNTAKNNLPYNLFSKSVSTITEVNFVGDITAISPSAFNGFTALTSIKIPDTVTLIDTSAFLGCTALAGNLVIPKNVVTINATAFSGCSSITKIKFSKSGKLKTIGQNAFKGLNKITSVIIPEGVTTIGSKAFENCTALEEVYIPSTITSTCTSWTGGPFYGCFNIKKITVPNKYVSGNGGMYCSYYFYQSRASITEVNFSDAITGIGQNAFNSLTALTSITIPETVTTIGEAAFNGCTSLSGDLVIPASVTIIDASAFSECNSINNLIFANNSQLTSIGQNTFKGLSKIKKAIIPEGVTTIEKTAFNSCIALEEVYIPSTITSTFSVWNDGPFYGCKSIKKITVPNKYVSGNGGMYCNYFFYESRASIVEVNFSDAITAIGQNAFNGFTALSSITIPETVTTIGGTAFNGCTSLSGDLVIPASVKIIDASAFSECNSINNLIFANNSQLTSIGQNTFKGLSKIKKAIIPEGVTTIGNTAFNSCTALEEVYLPSTLTSTVSSWSSGPFYLCANIQKITVPNKYVSGNGGIALYYYFNNSLARITEVNFSGEITSIGASAFAGFTALTSIVIPSSVETIGTNAFYNCTNLQTIYYAGNATGAKWGAPNSTNIVTDPALFSLRDAASL